MHTLRKLIPLAGGLAIVLLGSAGLVAAQSTNFVADLSGSQQVPPIETVATGQATFQLNPDGAAVIFELTVANIENVVASHIHCGGAGENGPIGVILSGDAPGPANGILAHGTIMAPDPGNGCGWTNFGALLGAMQNGNTYVNVHTAAHSPGEIRGQIR